MTSPPPPLTTTATQCNTIIKRVEVFSLRTALLRHKHIILIVVWFFTNERYKLKKTFKTEHDEI